MPKLLFRRSGLCNYLGPPRRNPSPKPFLPTDLCWSAAGPTGVTTAVVDGESDEDCSGGEDDLQEASAVFDFPTTQSQQLPTGSYEADDSYLGGGHDEGVWWKQCRLSQRRSKAKQDQINAEVLANICDMLNHLEKVRKADEVRKQDRKNMPPPHSVSTVPGKRQQKTQQTSHEAKKQLQEHTMIPTAMVVDSPLPYPSSQYQVEMYAQRLPKPVCRGRKRANDRGTAGESSVVRNVKTTVKRVKRNQETERQQRRQMEEEVRNTKPSTSNALASKRRRTRKPLDVCTVAVVTEQFSENSLDAYNDSEQSSSREQPSPREQQGKATASNATPKLVPVFKRGKATPQATTRGQLLGVRTPRLGMSRQRSPLATISNTCNTFENYNAAVVTSTARNKPATLQVSTPSMFSPSISIGNECELPFSQSSLGSQTSFTSAVSIYCSAVDDGEDEDDNVGINRNATLSDATPSKQITTESNMELGLGGASQHGGERPSLASGDSPQSEISCDGLSASQAWISGGDGGGDSLLGLSQLSQSSQYSGKFKVPYRKTPLCSDRMQYSEE